jgi:hypothetical protein
MFETMIIIKLCANQAIIGKGKDAELVKELSKRMSPT